MAETEASTSDTPRLWIGAVQDEYSMYSNNQQDYNIGPPIGFGASSVVYSAEYCPPEATRRIPVALKVVDLERLPQSALRLLTRETQLMSLSKHPNVLRVRGTWVNQSKLYIALRLMRSGSISDLMRYKFAAGVEEEVAKCILKQALEGLNYLHVNGLVHRDIKAANLLLDEDGTVLVGDLGVAASLVDEDAHKHAANVPVVHKYNADATYFHPPLHTTRPLGKRKSFVGTPCWMAPEVIAQKQYDASADIWSLGITALELCNGRAPHSRDPPAKVLQKILHQAPPTLDRKAGVHHYSKEFKEIIESCLVKDPAKRPTAAQLLETPFFKNAKRKIYLRSALIEGLPPLTDRQERRKHASIASFPSASSWDFGTTLHMTPPVSPTQSVYSKAASPTRARTRETSVPPMGVFEIDDEGEEIVDTERTVEPLNRSGSRISMGPQTLSKLSARTASISEENYEHTPDLSEPSPAPTVPEAAELVSKSFSSSSSSSNVVGPATPPSSSNATPSIGSRSTTGNMWKMITGRTKGSKDKDKDNLKPSTEKRRSGFGALLERTTR